MNIQRALIAGGQGQLAQALARLAPAGVECRNLSSRELDIRDIDAVRQAVEAARPDIVLNGAAYNLVDKAEGEGMRVAWEVNALGPSVLSAVCREARIPLVHFSTDYVFDGQKRTPYEEADTPRPLSVYAASKLAGENVTLAGSPQNFAIRVCRLFGPTMAEGAGSSQKPAGNFPLLMLRLGRERGSVRVVNDQIGTPTYTPDLARGVWQLAASGQGGLYHITNGGEVAFDEYAREIFRIANVECEVVPISTQEYGAPAARPLYSTLSNARAHQAGVVPLRSWQDALREFLETL